MSAATERIAAMAEQKESTAKTETAPKPETATKPSESPIQPADSAAPAASDDAKAKAQAAEEAALAKHPNKGQFVQYLGPRNAAAAAAKDEFKKRAPQLGEGTFAEITPTHWGQAGIASSRTHRWSLANNYRIPATQFTPEQIDHLLTVSRRFELVDETGAKVDR
jgi:hypothetical protein